MIDVAIQIVNYKTKSYLSKCISSILDDFEGCSLSYKICVLDNNSGDDLGHLEEEFKNKQVSFFYDDKNNGFGYGHNILSKKFSSRLILILNPDVYFIRRGSISDLVKTLDRDDCCIVGPKLINKRGIQKWDHGDELEKFSNIFEKLGIYHWTKRVVISKVAWVSGACFLIKRDVFNKLGGFDERFFLYKEEEDLCLRARRIGCTIVYNPDIEVFHYGSVVASKYKSYLRSHFYFIKKFLFQN